MSETARRILEHFRNGGLLDDSTIEAMYRKAKNLAADVPVAADTVKSWAFDEATKERMKGAGK